MLYFFSFLLFMRRILDSTIYVFDLDGTLTPPRKPMAADFAEKFEGFLKASRAFIATGSDLAKVQEQMPQHIMDCFEGIFCSMGNLLWAKGETVYKNEIEIPAAMLEKLHYYRANTKYPGPLYDNFIEKRTGMLNFSVLGRNCPYEAREDYRAWDSKSGERKAIQKELLSLFPGWEVAVGGSISIDITPAGKGKSQIAAYLRQHNPAEKIIFFGDRTLPGGNDYELAQALAKMDNTKTVQISGPEEVLEILQGRN